MNNTIHVGVNIDRAISMIVKENISIFTGPTSEALRDLYEAKDAGHIIYTGCDNVDAEGRCLGHNLPASE